MAHSLRKILLGAAGAAAALGAYAAWIEPRWIQVTRTRVRVDGLPPALEGLRLALLTDLHAGRLTPTERLRRACRMAMAEHPDVVALTGDLVSGGEAAGGARAGRAMLPEVVTLLDEELAAPLGLYVVPGNHDHAAGIEAWYRQVGRKPRLQDLTDRSVEVEHAGARICLAGTDDLDTGAPRPDRTLARKPASDLTIVLTHNPEMAEQARHAFERVDLVVSGHTHGGQIRLPFLGPLSNPVEHDRLYEAGLRQRPWTQVYVSRGIGMVRLPLRFLARPEVAILEFTGRTDRATR